VIPGSSIGLVYKDVVEHLADLDTSTRRLQQEAFASLQHLQGVLISNEAVCNVSPSS